MAVKHYTQQILRQLIEERGISLKELSSETGVAAPNISRLLSSSDSNPTLSTLMPIARFFGVSVSMLIGESVDEAQSDVEVVKALKQSLKLELKRHIDEFFDN